MQINFLTKGKITFFIIVLSLDMGEYLLSLYKIKNICLPRF